MKSYEASIELLNDKALIEPLKNFLYALVNKEHVNPLDTAHAMDILESVLIFLLNQKKEIKTHPLRLNLTKQQEHFLISVHNVNRPVHEIDVSCQMLSTKSTNTTLSLENRGRFGQVFQISLPLKVETITIQTQNPTSVGTQHEALEWEVAPHAQSAQEDSSGEKAKIKTSNEVVIRNLNSGEEPALSELFYKTYGYDYISEWVYFPEQISKLIATGDLHSVIAAKNDSVIGHIGVRTLNHSPKVAEMCMGLTDPTANSKGYFSQIFDACIQYIRANHFSYSFFDCVTNHDLSQRHIQKHGGIDTALFVGCQSKATQARLAKIGLGNDPQGMDRYSILYSIIPMQPFCFGTEVVLPVHLGDLLGFLLEPLSLRWVPSSRVDVLPRAGQFEISLDKAQNSAFFSLSELGLDPLHGILERWRNLLRDGYEYAAVDIPLGSPGLAMAHELLAKNGFFIAGFFPWHNSNTFALRLQFLAPKRVAFDHIKVLSTQAKKLLQIIREDYERNSLI